MRNSEHGNAFLYILIAVAMFAALMFAISRSVENDSPQSQMDDSKAKIAANDILSYAAIATNAVTLMDQAGTEAAQINFMYPSDVNFNVAPTIDKIFHPDGGGLNYKTLPQFGSDNSTVGLTSGYYIGRFNNVVWTPTTGQDVIFTAFGLSQSVCAAINKKIVGSETIPATVGGDFKRYLIEGSVFSGVNVDLDNGVCPACEDIAALCVSNTSLGVTKYAFYNILVAE